MPTRPVGNAFRYSAAGCAIAVAMLGYFSRVSTGRFDTENCSDTCQVIAMKMAWKSGLRREPMDLLRPNPFYLDLVGRLIEAQEVGAAAAAAAAVVVADLGIHQPCPRRFKYVAVVSPIDFHPRPNDVTTQRSNACCGNTCAPRVIETQPVLGNVVGVLGTKEWRGGKFMAVQWRTETSTGNNLTRCYESHVRPSVEERRKALGLEKRRVFFNTDLVGQASTTYNASVSRCGSKVCPPALLCQRLSYPGMTATSLLLNLLACARIKHRCLG